MLKVFSIFLIMLNVLMGVLAVERTCLEYTKGAMTISNPSTSDEASSNVPAQDCPVGCHLPNGHCHGPCVQQIVPKTSFAISELPKLRNIPFKLPIHADPDIEGSRKPPKIS